MKLQMQIKFNTTKIERSNQEWTRDFKEKI